MCSRPSFDANYLLRRCKMYEPLNEAEKIALRGWGDGKYGTEKQILAVYPLSTIPGK